MNWPYSARAVFGHTRVWLGIGLSVVAMLAASAGYLAPLVGAFLQEGIDVLVIVNALRATRGARS